MEPSISRSIDIAAAPDVVWALVTDLPRMGEFSPENVGGRWLDGATGPVVGGRYRGHNRNGRRRWSTHVRVVAYEHGRLFTFDVRSAIGTRVSRWSYQVVATPDGCRLTENWFRVGNWFVRRILGPQVTGQADRPGFNAYSIEHTLAKVKVVAEAAACRAAAA